MASLRSIEDNELLRITRAPTGFVKPRRGVSRSGSGWSPGRSTAPTIPWRRSQYGHKTAGRRGSVSGFRGAVVLESGHGTRPARLTDSVQSGQGPTLAGVVRARRGARGADRSRGRHVGVQGGRAPGGADLARQRGPRGRRDPLEDRPVVRRGLVGGPRGGPGPGRDGQPGGGRRRGGGGPVSRPRPRRPGAGRAPGAPAQLAAGPALGRRWGRGARAAAAGARRCRRRHGLPRLSPAGSGAGSGARPDRAGRRRPPRWSRPCCWSRPRRRPRLRGRPAPGRHPAGPRDPGAGAVRGPGAGPPHLHRPPGPGAAPGPGRLAAAARRRPGVVPGR